MSIDGFSTCPRCGALLDEQESECSACGCPAGGLEAETEEDDEDEKQATVPEGTCPACWVPRSQCPCNQVDPDDDCE